MMHVQVIGSGAVAQLTCRNLVENGCKVSIFVPKSINSKHGKEKNVNYLSCLPWMQGVRIYSIEEAYSTSPISAELQIFAGSMEQWFTIQKQHLQRWNVPILLFTSWWDSLNILKSYLHHLALPTYPKITVESWQERLVSIGNLKLELPKNYLSNQQQEEDIANTLKKCGINAEWIEMEDRFKARFAMTSFTYWYLIERLQTSHSQTHSIANSAIVPKWQIVESLAIDNLDIIVPLESLLIFLDTICKLKPENNDLAWIVHVIVNYKRGKMNYFLNRSNHMFNTKIR